MTNGSKFEPRKQMNRVLKPGGVRILNLLRTILQCLCCRIFTSNAFSICLDGHFMTLCHGKLSWICFSDGRKGNGGFFLLS